MSFACIASVVIVHVCIVCVNSVSTVLTSSKLAVTIRPPQIRAHLVPLLCAIPLLHTMVPENKNRRRTTEVERRKKKEVMRTSDKGNSKNGNKALKH